MRSMYYKYSGDSGRFTPRSTQCFASLAFLLVLTLFVMTGCGSSNNTSDNADYDFSYSDRDSDPSYDADSATVISLADDNIKITGDGAKASAASTVSITKEGTYILSGSLSDGQIIIETATDEKVQLVLDGVSLASSQSAPLHIKESDKVFITLADKSTNTLTGPASYSEEASKNNIDGVIFSKADLTINGNGSLSVTASSGHGIVSKDDLIITGGSIDVTASGDGLQGKDCVKIKDGTINIDSENDGIRSSNSEDKGRGFITVDGGNITVDAGYDGLQAATALRIADGELNITTGGGSEYASTEDDWGSSWGSNKPDARPNGMGGDTGSPEQPDGNPGQPGISNGSMENPGQPGDMKKTDDGSLQTGNTDSADTADDPPSAKGLKANIDVRILGGNITIDSSDDAVHSNSDVHIKNGNINASTGDDGVHADYDLVVKGGSINITQSYEGLEGNTVTIDGGSLNIKASDDGLNAAGGKDGSSTDGRAGQNDFAADESAYIEINGGTINITASGDSLDSNGSLTITGGTITLTGPTQGDTSVIDYESEGIITGGTFIGTGAIQMAQSFSSSEQGVIAINSGKQNSGTAITLKDNNGKTILSHKPEDDFAFVIISTPDIVSGETYTISIGSSYGEITAEKINGHANCMHEKNPSAHCK